MENNSAKDFECPVCSLKKWLIEVLGLKEAPPKTTERFHEELGKALKGRGLAPPNFKLFLQFKQGVVSLPPQVEARVPIGAEVPAYAYATDICTGCGTIYAVMIQRATAKKEAGRPKVDIATLKIPGMGNNPQFS